MGIVELLFVGVGVAMDAFAVSICKGLAMRRVNWLHAFIIALFFGGFQALMPFIGWLLGSSFVSIIQPIDHWIAFGLLAFLGGKTLWDGIHEQDNPCSSCHIQQTGGEAACATCDMKPQADSTDLQLDLKELFLMAVATSIDALAVGVTFAFLNVNIGLACLVMGLVTFAISFVGVAIGNSFGAKFERKATIFGGIVLIVIGVKILLDHLLA